MNRKMTWMTIVILNIKIFMDSILHPVTFVEFQAKRLTFDNTSKVNDFCRAILFM